MSLPLRAAEFNRHFKTDKANAYFIRVIYRSLGVKRKMIRLTKILNPQQTIKQQNEIHQLKNDILSSQLDGQKLIQIDEMMATVGTIPKVCWSGKKDAMKIDRKWINSQSIAVIAAISQEGGVELVQYYKRSIDRWDFAAFLRELHSRQADQKVCLYYDQLPVHKSLHVKDTISELNMNYLLNAAYYPDGNGIEFIFAKVKDSFKKQRIHSILNGKRDRAKVQLKRAFETVTVDDCKNAIQRSLKNINEFQ